MEIKINEKYFLGINENSETFVIYDNFETGTVLSFKMNEHFEMAYGSFLNQVAINEQYKKDEDIRLKGKYPSYKGDWFDVSTIKNTFNEYFTEQPKQREIKIITNKAGMEMFNEELRKQFAHQQYKSDLKSVFNSDVAFEEQKIKANELTNKFNQEWEEHYK